MYRGYDAIEQLKRETGENIPELLVLAQCNDLFYAGSRALEVKAQWFAELWQQFGFTPGYMCDAVTLAWSASTSPTENLMACQTKTQKKRGTSSRSPVNPHGTSETLAKTVTGAATADYATALIPHSLHTVGITYSTEISAGNTIAIKRCNNSGRAAPDPAATSIKFIVMKVTNIQ